MSNPFDTIIASFSTTKGVYSANTAYALNDIISVDSRDYIVTEAGTTDPAGTAPTHTSGEVLDGTVLWDWYGYNDLGSTSGSAGVSAGAAASEVPLKEGSTDPSEVDLNALSSQPSGGSAMTTGIFTNMQTEFDEK